jgi:hypothetical protein
LLPTLFTLVNNIEQYCWAWIGYNNIVQHCWQQWTMFNPVFISIVSIVRWPRRVTSEFWLLTSDFWLLLPSFQLNTANPNRLLRFRINFAGNV